ncbi:hypothetical protein FA15DRAFT_676039, partial [Coprinopsis marcescibilis]
ELDVARPQGELTLFAHARSSSHLSMISRSGAFGMCSTTELGAIKWLVSAPKLES